MFCFCESLLHMHVFLLSFLILSLSSCAFRCLFFFFFFERTYFELVILLLLISFRLNSDKPVSKIFFSIKALWRFKVMSPKVLGWLFTNTQVYHRCNKTSLAWHQVSVGRLVEYYLNDRKLWSPAENFYYNRFKFLYILKWRCRLLKLLKRMCIIFQYYK